MRRTLLILLVLVGLLAGAAFWVGQKHASAPGSERSATDAPAASAAGGALSNPAAGVERDRDATRREALPTQPVPEPAPAAATPEPDPARPLPGADVRALFGGAEVFNDFYRDIPAEGRRSRLTELEEALAQYTDGDPSDPREFQKYQALKDEAEWLRAHIEN